MTPARLLLTAAALALAAWVAVCWWSRVVRAVRAARTTGARSALVAHAGFLLTHASVLIVVAGGIWLAVAGTRRAAPAYLSAGGELDVPEGGFSLRVDDAWTRLSDGGRPVEYVSLVTVLEGGMEAGQARIEVNHPLVRNGVGIYQLEMLPSATRIERALLEVTAPTAEGERTVLVEAPFEESAGVPGTGLAVTVLAFCGDFTYDIERRTAAARSVRHENPAVLVRVEEAGRVVGERWVFARFPGHETVAEFPARMLLLDYEADYRHGLTRFEISRQPGAPLLYAGLAAMSLGLFVVYRAGAPRSGRRAGAPAAPRGRAPREDAATRRPGGGA